MPRPHINIGVIGGAGYGRFAAAAALLHTHHSHILAPVAPPLEIPTPDEFYKDLGVYEAQPKLNLPMQTPNTPRGRETERLMLLWRKQNPDADSSAYNRKWSATYAKLEGTFSDKEDSPRRGFLDDLEDGQPRYIVKDDGFHPVPAGIVTPPKRRREKRICKANYPATKGAFGKPKHLRRR